MKEKRLLQVGTLMLTLSPIFVYADHKCYDEESKMIPELTLMMIVGPTIHTIIRDWNQKISVRRCLTMSSGDVYVRDYHLDREDMFEIIANAL